MMDEQDPRLRFIDNPFRPRDLSPEQVDRIEQLSAALDFHRETGDRTMLEELGFAVGQATEQAVERSQ